MRAWAIPSAAREASSAVANIWYMNSASPSSVARMPAAVSIMPQGNAVIVRAGRGG